MSAVFPIETKARYAKYTATAGQTLFDIPFEFQQNRDVKVQKTAAAGGSSTILTEGADYTVAGAGIYNGGSFTLVAGAAAGDTLEIWGESVLDRKSSVVQNGIFSSKTQDDEHDRHRIIQQELAEIGARSVKRPRGEDGYVMGDITTGHFAKMGENGVFEDGGSAADIINAQAYASSAGTAASTATAAAESALAHGAPRFDTKAKFELANVSAVIMSVAVVGISAIGDCSPVFLERIDTPDPVQAWHWQSNDGAYWQIKNRVLETAMFSENADGVGDDTTVLLNVAAAAEAIGAEEIRLTKGGNYLIDAWDLSSNSNLKIVSNGAQFTERTGSATNTDVFMTLGAGVELDYLTYTLPTGKTRYRVIVVSGTGAKLGGWSITAVDQQNNRNGNDDAAVTFSGALVAGGAGDVTNFDNAYRIDSTDHRIGELRCSSYVRGAWFDSPTRGRVDLVQAKTASPNASVTPGHNGCLLHEVTEGVIYKIDVEDAGEHGVRFGGSGSDGIDIGVIRSHNAGGCGLKFRSDAFGNYHKNANIRAVIISDAGTGAVAGDWGPNEEGVLIERVLNLRVEWVHIFKVSKAKSCARGILVNSSQGVFIGDGLIEDCDDDALLIDNTDDSGVNYRDVTDISVTCQAKRCERGGQIDYSNITVRGINVCMRVSYANSYSFFLAAGTGGTLGTVADVCRIDMVSESPGTGHLTYTGSINTAHWFIKIVENGLPTSYMPTPSTSTAIRTYYTDVGGAKTPVNIIRGNGANENVPNSYGALSDLRLKSVEGDASSQWDDIKAMHVVNYVNKVTGQRELGVISQELEKTSPGLVRDMDLETSKVLLRVAFPELDGDGLAALLAENGPLKAVVYSVINVKLLKAFQEAQQRIEALELASGD
ncbi:hypothetical protein ACSSV1_001927 [Labrenzia sp. MBR-25]